MSGNKRLSEKEIALIDGIRSGEKTVEIEFIRRYKPKIFAIALQFTKDKEEAEELTQNIFMIILEKIKKHKIKQSLNGWIIGVSKNYCIDVYRKKHLKKALRPDLLIAKSKKGATLIDSVRDFKATAPGSKEYYKQQGIDETLLSNIDVLYKRNIAPEIQKSLYVSLEYIELFYNLRKQIKSDLTKKYERILDVDNILNSTKKKINYILGPVSEEKINRYKNLRFHRDELSDLDKKELNRLERQSFKINVHKDLNELIERVSAMLFHSPLFNDLALVKNTPYVSHDYFGFMLSDLASILPTIKIKPPRLMFSIWIKAKGLRKGKYADLKKIRLIFLYFKKQTKGTEKEFLFDSIDENVSTFDALRKSCYKKSANQKFYKKLVNNIYKNSFIYTKEEK